LATLACSKKHVKSLTLGETSEKTTQLAPQLSNKRKKFPPFSMVARMLRNISGVSKRLAHVAKYSIMT
jgi:hypothetical protein